MKKIFSYLFTAALFVAGFSACSGDYIAGPMARNITTAPSIVETAAGGQSFDATVTADGAWVADTPDWITVSPKRGEGNETVRVTVAANEGGERTDKVKFYSAVGTTSTTSVELEDTPLAELTVKQEAAEGQGGGGEAQTISIADYLALGENADTYIITGTITRVANTNYGNFDLTDETGTLYVYGLLTEELESQKCFREKELAMGDVLTVKATNLQLYKGTTWEIVDAIYISHTKSLIALDEDHVSVPKEGGYFEVNAEVKGADVKANFDADWIKFESATKSGDIVTLGFTAAANEGEPRNAVISISTTTAKGESSEAEFTVSQDGNIPDVTVAEVLAAEDDVNSFYRITGYISKVTDIAKGRIYVTDYTGTIYAYGTKVAKDSDVIDLTTLGIEAGDIVTIVGYKSSYNGSPQIVGFVESFSKVEAVTVADFLAKEESAEKWYKLKGTVTKPNDEEAAAGNKWDLETYGNFVLEDETGRAYVYGVLTGYGQTDKTQFATLGVKENDIITIVGNRAAYKGAPQVGKAWYVTHEEGKDPEQPDPPQPPVEEGQTVSEILTLDNDAPVKSAESLVMAVTARGFIASDGTKAVYVYCQGSDFNGIAKVGDKVRFSGRKTVYGGVHEVQTITALEVVSSGNEVVYPEPVDLNPVAETYTNTEAEYVCITGTLKKSGNYYNIILDGIESKQGSIVYPVAELGADAFDGKKIKITGFFNGLTGSGKYINIITTSIVEVQ